MQKYTENNFDNNGWGLLDKNLSLKAKGLWWYMLFRNNQDKGSWVFRKKDLVNMSKDGGDSVTAALKELTQAGLVERIYSRSNGKFTQGSSWIVHNKPKSTVSPKTSLTIKADNGKWAPLVLKSIKKKKNNINKLDSKNHKKNPKPREVEELTLKFEDLNNCLKNKSEHLPDRVKELVQNILSDLRCDLPIISANKAREIFDSQLSKLGEGPPAVVNRIIEKDTGINLIEILNNNLQQEEYL